MTLVMVDGESTGVDLASLKPELPDVAQSLERLLREGYIEVISPPSIPFSAAAIMEPETSLACSPQNDKSVGLDSADVAVRWARRALVLLPFLVLLAALFLADRSLEHFASSMKEALAMQVENVSIGTSSIILAPRPALELKDIAVGKALKVGEIVARPAWSTLLLGGRGPIALLELREATLTTAELLALLQGGGGRLASEGFQSERVILKASKLDVGGIILAPLAGDLRYAPNGQLERATLSIDDGRAEVTVVTRGVDAAVEFSARDWSTPTAPPVSFARLDASGHLERNRLVLGRIEGLIHDGLVKGDVLLDWSAGLLAEGRFSAVNVELQGPISKFTGGFSVGGRLDAEGSFTARADSPGGLLENVSIGADFRVKRGIIYNADLTAAAAGNRRGGTTQFDELTGNVQTAGRSLSVQRIQLASGLVTAKGSLDITPSRQITGRFAVRLKSQGDVSNTISVGGSLKEPRLQLGG